MAYFLGADTQDITEEIPYITDLKEHKFVIRTAKRKLYLTNSYQDKHFPLAKQKHKVDLMGKKCHLPPTSKLTFASRK